MIQGEEGKNIFREPMEQREQSGACSGFAESRKRKSNYAQGISPYEERKNFFGEGITKYKQ
ncbi:MAG: hypothetical protein IK000_09470 [Bacteroidaceae bacterium]|nr:hypothetical protein [Bacteroidaceae bacterium]